MERHHIFQVRPHVFHAGDLGEEGGELKNPLLQGMNARQRLRILAEQLGEMVHDHGGAGARRHHDAFGGCEGIEEVARHNPRLVAVAAVEGRLPATGLVLWKIHLIAEPLDDSGHGHADLGKELIDHAGNK